MQSSIQALRRSHILSRHRKFLSTAPEQSKPKYPVRVGGVHYQEGDRVIAINKDGRRVKSRLLPPLAPGGNTRTGDKNCEIKHSDIIGQPTGRLYINAPSVSAKLGGSTFRIAHPSLEQFVALAPRTVTPIYSSYGATIVTLLDLHVAPPLPSNDPQETSISRLEILEAGTGNGGLTLHLARAIAAANPPPPHFNGTPDEEQPEHEWQEWRAKRRAVIHTVEFQRPRSRAAEKLIKSFRGALYWPHIDFHSGDVGTWVQTEHDRRREVDGVTGGFLDIVILDLPAVHQKLQHVVEAMKDDAQLVVWVPQITQVASCQYQIEQLGLQLKLDQVLELGEGISNGRRWDMRFVQPRAEKRQAQNQTEEVSADSVDSSTVEEEDSTPSVSEEEASQSTMEFPTMVCRPIVGELIMGGGFVGLWRKVPSSSKPAGS